MLHSNIIPVGAKVIYAYGSGFDRKEPRVGYLIQQWSVEPACVVADTPDATHGYHIHVNHVHQYSDGLWAAWCQWLHAESLLMEQHKQLMAGKAPEELLTLSLF